MNEQVTEVPYRRPFASVRGHSTGQPFLEITEYLKGRFTLNQWRISAVSSVRRMCEWFYLKYMRCLCVGNRTDGTDTELTRHWYGTDMALLRNCHGTDTELIRNWHVTDTELTSLIMHWYGIDTALIRNWHVTDTELTRHWLSANPPLKDIKLHGHGTQGSPLER
jgi:hypothetical protein